MLKGVLRKAVVILLFFIFTLFLGMVMDPVLPSAYVPKENYTIHTSGYDPYQVYMANVFFTDVWIKRLAFQVYYSYGYFTVPDSVYFEILKPEYLQYFGIDIPE